MMMNTNKKITASLFVLVLALVVVGTAKFCAASSPPELQSPEDGAVVTIGPITFSWGSVPEAQYYVLVTGVPGVEILGNWFLFSIHEPSFITATSWTLSTTDLNDLVYDWQDTFYWKVFAYYGPYLTLGPDSSIWCFHVLKTPSGWIDVNYWNGITETEDSTLWESMASGPLGGWGPDRLYLGVWTSIDRLYWASNEIAVTTPHSVPLIWSDRSSDSQQTPVAFADRYRVQLSASSSFDSLIVDITTENISYTTPELSPGAYYWRVRSERDGLVTEWNSPRRFYIASGGVTTDSDSDGMPDSWEAQYGLNPNGPGDAGQDMDGDGYTNLQEYQAGTDPTSASSHPGVAPPVILPAAVTVTNIPAKLGQTISVGENGVASVTVSLSPNMVQVNFENEQPVDSITIFTDAAMETVSARVEPLSQKPAAVPEPTASLPGIIVSHYMEITVTPSAAALVQVENAWVNFRVPKSWLSNNNINPLRVLLLRYSNGQWNEKFAILLEKEDATYKYYFASVPGFSTFAVAGEAAPSGQTQPIPTTVFIAVLAVAIAVGVITTIIRLKRH